jgi:putative peptide-modifying radical SAM enzyme
MFFHIILTTECNLQCKYCFAESIEDFDSWFPNFEIDYSLPKKIIYKLDSLSKFCSLDSECTLIFYGGEPLLCVDKIKEIMNYVPAKYYVIQTNGTYLDRLEPKYLNRIHTIFVSIDGDEVLTDFYRGKGTFRKVIDNLKLIKRGGFTGELIARMTVMEQTDIFKQVTWLLSNDEFPFSSVHWQLNAGFWGNDFAKRDFKKWSEENYNPGIKKLVRFWVDYMENTGIVLRLYPFLGIANSLLLHEKASLLRCGGGWINYTIQTDGRIIPCPTMWGIKDYYLGHINYTNPLNLEKIFVGEPCTKCDIFNLCGGRCLYANLTRRWKNEAYSLVCATVRNLIDAVIKELPRIKMLIRNGRVRLKDFKFVKYNGCEIIP